MFTLITIYSTAPYRLSFENLSSLAVLQLAGNQLTGPIPSDLTNLANLNDSGSDFRWNALFTADDALRTFLNSKQNGGDWESTQTIAPTGLTVTGVTYDSVTLSWTPATYQSDPGGYVLEYGLSSGVYTTTETIADKTANTFTVTGLVEGADYYFHIGTYTDPHASNQNTVYSDYSDELQAQTPVNTDTDGDGLPDAWEQQIIDADANDAIVTFADVLPGDDFDDDGVTNADELANGISPINPDSDGDGYNDGQEIAAGTSPLDNTDYEAGPERAALMALYNATNGDGWTNNSGWKTPPLAADGFAFPGTECGWHGVTCSSDQVTRLNFKVGISTV